MLALLLTLLIVAIFTLLYLKWIKVKNYWAERNIPHLPPHPLMGSLTFLQKKNPGVWMREMYKRFPTPYFGIWLFWRPALVVNSPEISRRILVLDFNNFRNRFLGSGDTDPLGKLNMFAVDDPIWTSIKRPLTTLFSGAKLKSHHNLLCTKVSQLVNRIKTEIASNKNVDLRSVYTDYTTDIIGTSAFGVTCNAITTGTDPFRKITQDLTEYNILRGIAWSCIFFFPNVTNILRLKMFPKTTNEYFTKIFRTVVQHRGGYGVDITETRDLMDVLLKMKRQADQNGKEMSEELLIAQAAVFLQGGFDTSAVSMTFTTYELAYHPDIQEKVYKELVETKERINGAEFDGNLLAELPYLNAIIKESLRKYPPMSWLDRVASKDYQIDENLTITAGTPVYINGNGMHYDPNYFPEPEKFYPERFLPENEKNITPFTYFPFGEGPRTCIGKRFAYQTIRYALSALILNFEFRPVPNAPTPNDCEIEKNGMFLMPGQVLSVEFIPRS